MPQLPTGEEVLLDDQDLPLWEKYRWRRLGGMGGPYAVRTYQVNRKQVFVLLHREIMNAVPGLEVDHINGNTLDCRRLNLRLCTHKQNLANQKKQSGRSSQFKGVSFSKSRGKWEAYIKTDGKKKHLGRFDTEEAAAYAYDLEAFRLFGWFAKLNGVLHG